jgi:2,4-dienoyl-CoA reductase-like NADH-dependent reductase (Old Yellow Enzyme family)
VKLFEPYPFPNTTKTSANRIALAPMTNGQSNDDGTLGDDEYNWLIRRAKEGFGIIFTCAAHVSKEGQGWAGELGIWHEDHIPGLKRLADGIHQYGSLAIVQIFHGGARSPESLTGVQPWSASSHEMTVGGDIKKIREGSISEIEDVIEAFVKAAQRAYLAGMDGIELHAAHGYLLHQFISSATNQRTDQYGGNFENRIRLVREILQRIKAILPPTFLVGIRISPEDKYTFKGIDFDESLRLAQILKEDGADFLDISTWDSFASPQKYPESQKPVISWFRKQLGANFPLFVAGELWSAAQAHQALNLGADFVSLGRVAIGIADWPSKAKDIQFEPQLPPYSALHLQKASLSHHFIEYMKRWKGFVADEPS